MPEVIETTVYTLAELEEISFSAHERAIEAVCATLNDGGDYVSWITEDLNMRLEEEKPVAEVKVISWSYDQGFVELKGDIELPQFMAAKKLRGKNRALWHMIRDGGVIDHWRHFDTSKCNDHEDKIAANFVEDIYRYTDLYHDDRKRYDLLERQIEVLAAALDGYIRDLESALVTMVRAEIEYRYSAEFAKEEAEAHEMRFDENGALVNW